MEFTYEEIRKGLIKYLARIEHYKWFRSKNDPSVVYFYSPQTEYNVIRLSAQPLELTSDNELNQLVNKLQTSSHHQPKVLLLIISDVTKDLWESQAGYWELMTDEKNLKTKLEPIFARINHLKIESAQNTSFFKRASKIGDQDEKPGLAIDKSIDDVEEADLDTIQKEFKVFTARMSANRLILTWIMMALFGLIPLSGTIVCVLLKLDSLEASLPGLERLFTGGTHYTLTIAGAQWWRIFTFGVAVPGSGLLMNILVLILAGSALYSLNKYSETVIGIGKTLLVFILAYLLTGLFSTIMLPESTTGGILVVMAISLGILTSGIGVETSIKSRYVRMRLIWPVVVLMFFPLFLGSGLIDYVPLIAGLIFGATIMALIPPHKVQLSRITIILYGILLGTLLILILVFAFLPRFGAAMDNRVIYTLFSYVQHGFLPDPDYANQIMAKIGWTIRIEDVPGLGMGIVGI